MTDRLYLTDAMLFGASATVLSAGAEGIVLDRSPFYPRAGGQPGDSGTITWDGGAVTIVEARKGLGDAVLHTHDEGLETPPVGTVVCATIDEARRLRHMRMHTALHLLCALLPGVGVTGGQIGSAKSRLDVDLPMAPDKELLETSLIRLIMDNHAVTTEWVDESLLDTNPALVRTMSVQPPRGSGRLRLVRIGTGATLVDVQPCGGTHVAHTGLVGRVRIVKVENKGRQNRRISIELED